MTNNFGYVKFRKMFNRLLGKRQEKRGFRKLENPLISQVRKVLSSADQQLILMARR